MTPIRSILSRHIFRIYLLAIGGLSLYAWFVKRENEKQENFALSLRKDTQHLATCSSRNVDQNLQEINRKADIYQEAWMDKKRNEARRIYEICNKAPRYCSEKIKYYVPWRPCWEKEFDIDKALKYYIETADIPQITQRLREVADSLKVYSGDDVQLKNDVGHFFDEQRLKELENVLSNGTSAQVLLAATILELDLANISNDFIGSINEKLPKADTWVYTGYIPMVSVEKSSIRAGEYLEGTVFEREYNKSPHNIEMLVNDKPLTLYNGLAKFQQSYKTTGVKMLKAQVKLTNPITHKTDVFSRDIKFEVCE